MELDKVGKFQGLRFLHLVWPSTNKLQAKTGQRQRGSDSVWKRHWSDVHQVILISHTLLNILCSTDAKTVFHSLLFGTIMSLCLGWQPASSLLLVPSPILSIPPPLVLPSRLTYQCFLGERRVGEDSTAHPVAYFHKASRDFISEALSFQPDEMEKGQ